MKLAYIKGIEAALKDVGFKDAAIHDELTKGTPYPTKTKSIQAERLADMLQEDDTETMQVSPDNTHRVQWNKPVTWSAPVDLGGLDEGQPVAGIIAPSSPRS